MEVVKDIEMQLFSNLIQNFDSGILIWQLDDINDPNSFRLAFSNKLADNITGYPLIGFKDASLREVFPKMYNSELPEIYFNIVKNQLPTNLGLTEFSNDKAILSQFETKAVPVSHNALAVIYNPVSSPENGYPDKKNNGLYDFYKGANDGILIFNTNQNIIDANDKAQKLIGYSIKELRAINTKQILKKTDKCLKRFQEAIRKNKTKGKGNCKIKLKAKNGNIIPVKVYFQKLINESNTFIQCTIKDLSKNKKTKKKLRENKSRFKTLFELAPNGIIVFKQDGTILETNQQLDKIFGYEPKDLKDKNIDILLPPYLINHIQKRTLLTELQILFEKGNLSESINIHGVNKNNKTIPIAIKLTPSIFHHKKVTMASVVDMSFIKKRELELENSNHELEQFSYMATHDLKIPIANIKSHLEILKKECATKNQMVKTSIDWIDKSIQQANNTVNTISYVSKAQKQAGRNIKNILFEDILNEVKINLQSVISIQRAKIEYDFSKCSSIYYSHTDLFSILQNLISNAIKYRSDCRDLKILVKTKIIKNNCVLLVSDNGLGIDLKRNKNLLFKMFKRFHDHVDGNGIGLYMLRKIIEHNGGKIDVESEVDKGSTFKIFFKFNDFN